MEKCRHHDRTWLGKGLARTQIARVSNDDRAVLIISRERILRRRMGDAIQSRIDSRRNEEKADHQKSQSFKESFHGDI
jgi:hypothetical protein